MKETGAYVKIVGWAPYIGDCPTKTLECYGVLLRDDERNVYWFDAETTCIQYAAWKDIIELKVLSQLSFDNQ